MSIGNRCHVCNLFFSGLILSILSCTTVAVRPFRAIDVLNHHYYDGKQDEFETKITSRRTTSGDSNNNMDVQELFIEQHLDHFNAAHMNYTFQQRYFYSNRYVSKTTTTSKNNSNKNKNRRQLAFLCVGGEGPALDASVLIDSPHCTGDMLYIANRMLEESDSYLSIHLFALEHRYYGKSYPNEFPHNDYNKINNNTSNSPVSNDHLVYLSSRQALADLAHFVLCHLGQYDEWITFGGSYPGMLAAWARLHYPHLIHAAVSNSAPVQAVLDFAAYNNHVTTHALSDTSIGGSELCVQIFEKGHEQLAQAIDTNRYGIAKKLNLCNASALDDKQNVQLLIGDGLFYVGAQENDPSCQGYMCNIANKCQAMIEYYEKNHTNDCARTDTAEGTCECDCRREMNTLIWAYTKLRGEYQQECVELDWEETLNTIADPNKGMAGGLRSWLWQTCTEFGFYQTCEVGSSCPYGRGYHPLSQDLEMCEIAFGIAPQTVANLVQDTNIWSGGWNMVGSRILSVTGSVDPWSELAIQHNSTQNHDMQAYQVPGASHHFWTHQVKPTDSLEIQTVRDYIYQVVVQSFLSLQPHHENTAGQITAANVLTMLLRKRH